MPVIDEIKRANALVPEVIQSDRSAREQAYDMRAYDESVMDKDSSMVAAQVADAASTLASIWLYEWKQAGSPAACVGEAPYVSYRRRGRRSF
jgi:hypothetical protein